MGRPRRSQKEAELAGEKRPSRAEKSIQGTAGEPEPPLSLGHDGLAAWHEAAGLLRALGCLDLEAGPVLATYARATDRIVEASLAIATHGLVIETERGSLRSNPAAKMLNEAELIRLRCLGELGLTPGTRAKLKRPTTEAKSPLAEFAARRMERFEKGPK